MNPLRPPSSSSRQVRAGNGRVGKGTAGQGRGAPAAAVAGQFGVVAGAAVAPTVDRSSEAAAASPTLPSFEASYLPAWWTSSSPMGSNEGASTCSNKNKRRTVRNCTLVQNMQGLKEFSMSAGALAEREKALECI
ncbi:hypothetical protein BDA96_09G119300 [Sorghum bicolor]|uniref:Uncharacterized protein n=2 Tax=Sorghum bicolor TaxID=4558 RepID=A0A921QA09_SORBI|nr:hypothetical protein BDA96_09G119300 [Sorghum bicolor]KXG21834.1 hypothetical protein SORBI_3009G113600 [Sorghum bicolor]